ncbi:MAG: MBL fold metallo-hydrolase [Deltaproteobacteria bacterium]|nr:MBL fold metallo-hydrolase [Deltaproteobacteria bacterium]
MIIDQPGKVTDNITMLGKKASCVYLLDGGEACAILGGGLAYLIPGIEGQLAEMEIDPEKIKQLVIQHAHFDHCGIVPYFKKKWPWPKIVASAKAKTLLSTPKVAASIEKFNKRHLEEVLPQVKSGNLCIENFHIEVEKVVGDGDTLQCGGLRMQVLETPGHSTCSISVYVPEEKAMFASDAAGIALGEGVFTTANSSFDQYQASLEKIFEYDPEIILAEHQGARTGEDCRKFMRISRQSAREMRERVESSFARTGDIGRSTDEITTQLMASAPDGFLPAWVVKLVVGGMVYQTSKRIPG